MASLGCSLDVQQPQATLWEGQLQATGEGPNLTGSAAAVSRSSSTEAGIEVTGGEAGDRWTWRLREGTCERPGPVLGSSASYPVLEAAESTDPEAPSPVVTASGETVLSATLDPDGSYHATLAAESDPDVVLACGDLSLG